MEVVSGIDCASKCEEVSSLAVTAHLKRIILSRANNRSKGCMFEESACQVQGKEEKMYLGHTPILCPSIITR